MPGAFLWRRSAPGLKNRGLSGEVDGFGEEVGEAGERAEVGG
jgi:hypothetical protein